MMLHQRGKGAVPSSDVRGVISIATYAGANLTRLALFISRQNSRSRPSQDTVVGWSDDGKRLLFASDRSGSMALWSLPFLNGKVDGPPELLRRDIGQFWGLNLAQ